MKFKSKFLSKYTAAVVAVFLILNISGCVKKDFPSQITQVLFVPLSPNATAVDFAINGVLFATTVGYTTTAGTLNYQLPYYTLYPQDASVIAYKNPSGSNNTLAAITADLQSDKVYSTFLIDYAASAKVVIVNDDLRDPSSGKVKIRFFNFSPNAPAMDVVYTNAAGTVVKLFTGRAFNGQVNNPDYEKFSEIEAGVYTFLFNDAVTGATIYTTSALTLKPDRIYTLASRGFIGGPTGQAIGGFLYPNKP